MLTVHVAGLIYFDACRIDGKRALAPNGTQPTGSIPPHFASIWIDANRYESDTWWPGEKLAHALKVYDATGEENTVFVLEFRIPRPAELEFPDRDNALDATGLENALPKLQDLGFHLDPVQPDAIATIPIRGGILQPRSFEGVGVVQWTITNHPDSVTMSARDGAEVRTITLRSASELGKKPDAAFQELGIEVVFANTSDLFSRPLVAHAGAVAPSEQGDHGDTSHFKLYGKLDAERKTDNLVHPKLAENLDPLPFDHGFLRALVAQNQIPDGECTPTCC